MTTYSPGLGSSSSGSAVIIQDAGGEQVTVTDGKLDVNASVSTVGLATSVNQETLIKALYSEIDFVLQQENEWKDFTAFFDEIHPNYIKNLSNISTEDLSPAELKLGILLRLNLTSKEIASILRVTPDSVRVARHRFRKKLPIDSKQELINFLLEL